MSFVSGGVVLVVMNGAQGHRGRLVDRGPAGETWAGRGARPRWLTALIKEGRKIDEFAINKSAAVRKGAVAKKSRRKRK